MGKRGYLLAKSDHKDTHETRQGKAQVFPQGVKGKTRRSLSDRNDVGACSYLLDA